MGCFSCGRAIDLAAGERVGFRDECPQCGSDLHVCLNCVFHDPNAYNECRESNAERVSQRERANRCDYFEPRQGAGERGEGTGDALTALDSLFKKS